MPLVVGAFAGTLLTIAAAINLFSTSNSEFAKEKQNSQAERASSRERITLVESKVEALDGLPSDVGEIKVDIGAMRVDLNRLVRIAEKD